MDALSELLSKTSSRLDNLEQSYQSIAAGQYMLLMSDIENEINNCDASIPRDEKEYVQSILKKIDQNHQKIIDTQKKIFPGDDNPTLPWLKKSSH
mgnify:FL=1